MRNLDNVERSTAYNQSRGYPYRGWNKTGNLFRIRKDASSGIWYACGAPNDNHDLGSLYSAATLTELSELLKTKSGR